MYLKRLDIKGFKSFANETEIILEPGINIIVGPNGCGKSNIADAVRWVLGEGNVRQLRGQKNEDIIFNGTDKQKPQGMAMVDMTIDNSDHMLPVEYGEITVGRKLFRSGESEYLLNKSRVRMKDIVNLFTGTGLGKRGYSIIGQGELEQVLNGQAFDRRLILEEASGSIRFRQQRDEVKQRIAATTQDLQRLADIIGELEIRIVELEHKSAKAQSYLKIWEEYCLADKEFMGQEIKKIRQNLGIKKEELTKKTAHQNTLSGDLEKLQKELQEAELLLEEHRNTLTALAEQKHQLEAELSRLESEAKLGQERIHNYSERMLIATQDEQKYQQLLLALNQDLDKQIDDYNNEREKWQERQAELEELNREILELESAIQGQADLFELQREQMFERAKRESELKNNISDQEEKIKKAREKKERLQMRLEDNQAKQDSEQKKQQALIEQRQKRLNQQEQIQVQLDSLTSQQAKLNDEFTQLEKEHQEISHSIISVENKLLGLEDLKRKYAGYSEGVRAVLQAHSQGERSLRGIKGLMADIINVPSGMEMAIETAAGKGLENIVVAKAEDAREAIAFLKRQRLGRVTFLPLDVLRVQAFNPRVLEELNRREGVLGLASQLVKYDPQYKKAVDYLLGRVLLVSDLDCGLQVFKNSQPSLRIVSLEGDLINVSGAMTGGSAARHSNSPMMRKGEEKSLNRQLEQLLSQRNSNYQLQEQMSEQIRKLDEELLKYKNIMAENDFQIQLITNELNTVNSHLEQMVNENQNNLKEIKTLQIYAQDLQEELLRFKQDYSLMCTDNASFAEQTEAMKDTLQNERRDFEIRRERSLSRQDQLNMKKRELEKLEKNLAQFQEVQQSYQQSIEEAHKLKEHLIAESRKQVENLDLNQEQLHNQTEALKQLKMIIISHQEKLQLEGEEKEQLRQRLKPMLDEKAALEGEIRSLEMQMVRLESELKAVQEKWQEKYQSESPDICAKDLSPVEMRELKREIESLKDRIDAIGPVDIESIQEYAELKERYDFLRQQSDDLIEARQSLEKLLTETEKAMAKNFSQFMLLANESFKRTFTEIFGGGEASLVLEEDSHYLSAGVDIVLKMPGKRSQPLNLLSGGEKALTCIAFIFALLRLRPVPFCLLDEIDAALDETNLMRFTQFLKNMADEIQFIVITHRQTTIEAGSNIYGVTMPQQGISSVLSINVSDSISMAI
ncbi:Structural maintenance of chromosomes protein [Syntrophomonas zehnderi OL-4]|uniref:Chromosome partition protein Smc n=1 Tax=Syntrophomonas zehnderi OL-4 TaxID=690567 RepID=A0A0E3W3U4_9FIRM|nr:chromosome segregation protein SMC [Syntrophomonas zehnderi]CFY05581.1 Structural maintenance of chromosomes protein [Syntrophomonas zehnderi OL-4]